MELLIIDRIESGYAVCEAEGREMTRLHLGTLPTGVREGDCLRKNAGGYYVDRDETDRRRKEAAELFRRLAND